VLLSTPRPVPAYNVVGVSGSMASAKVHRSCESVSPALMRVQLPAPSVLLNTPRSVPAYSVAGVRGSIASALTCPPHGPPDVHVLMPACAGAAEHDTANTIAIEEVTSRPIAGAVSSVAVGADGLAARHGQRTSPSVLTSRVT